MYNYLFCLTLVPRYDITEPRPLQRENRRQKRNLSNGDNPETKFYTIRAFDEEHPLELSLNKNLMSPDLKVEVMRGDGTTEYHPAPRNSYYLGKVSDDPESMVAVSDAEGLVRACYKEIHRD